MSQLTVKIGCIPAYRWSFTPWCAKMWEQCLRVIAAVDGVEVVAPLVTAGKLSVDEAKGGLPAGAMNTPAAGEALGEYFRRQKVDGVMVCPLDFGDERSAATAAAMAGVPTLLLATKEPPALDDAGLSRVSDSYCGTLAISAALHRRNVRFHFAGVHFPDEPAFAVEVADFVRAVSTIKALKGARLGQIGVRPEPFESVAYDESALLAKFGQTVVFRELAQVVSAAKAYADDAPEVVKALADFKAGPAAISVADSYLLMAVKLELALVEFARANRLSALAIQCWSEVQRSAGVSVCATLGRLTERGVMAACEADVLGTVAMLTAYGSARGQTVPHLIDWTIQHRDDPNRVLAWHCGNAPLCLAADRAQTALRSRRDMKGAQAPDPKDAQNGLYQFQLKSGQVTLTRLAECDNQWKMLIVRGRIIPAQESLAGTWSWVGVTDGAKLYRTLIEEGFIHHAALVHGDHVAALGQVCKFLDIRPVVVE
jgi:L-fucose isomerase-like protein